jgi:hypothetical protein
VTNLTKEQAIAELRKLRERANMKNGQNQTPTSTTRTEDSKSPSLLKNKNKEGDGKQYIGDKSDESQDGEDGKRESLQIESDDDEEEDEIPMQRDALRRITFLNDQYKKLNIHDDLNFGGMFNSIIAQNTKKFDFNQDK